MHLNVVNSAIHTYMIHNTYMNASTTCSKKDTHGRRTGESEHSLHTHVQKRYGGHFRMETGDVACYAIVVIQSVLYCNCTRQ